MTSLRSLILVSVVVLSSTDVAHSQVKATVVATLGEQAITDRDIDFQLGRIESDGAEPLVALSPALMQSAIHLLAQQRQALQTLRTRKLAVGRDGVERWLDENGQPKNGEKITVAQIIREQAGKAGITESNFRDHFAFRLSWQNYLQKQLTEANVAKHFGNQLKRFDGTRFKVSIIDVAAKAGLSDRRKKLAESLTDLRGRLMSGELTWKELSSELKKIADGGDEFRVREDIWVRGTGDLNPTIISSLMKMEPSTFSEPIHTPTGVHLVKLIEVESGSRELAEARDEVRAHMLLHLLEHLASQSESQLPLKVVE